MRPLLLASVLVVAAGSGVSLDALRREQPRTLRDIVVKRERIDRFAKWLIAVHQHDPGEKDMYLEDIASWSADDLRALWADAKFLAALMRNLGISRVTFPDQRGTVAIIYPPELLQRMRAMACAASGRIARPDCVAIHAQLHLDDDLHPLAADAAADRERTGEDNFILRRAAILHADVEILERPDLAYSAPSSGRPLPGPQQLRVDTTDGVSLNVHEVGVHWEIARTLLELIKPKDGDRPQPGRDQMVRDWYRATTAWMQSVESHDTKHIDRGRDLFPSDPDLLFLSGTLHEVYATPEIQAAMHTVVMPTGYSISIGSARGELRQAEGFFRRAVDRAPEMAEAHLHLGRVLGLQGHHADAIVELRQALTHLDDDELRYDGELFAGAEEEALGRYDEAAAFYEQAAACYPGAQSPLIALSQLARRRGDRAGALAAMERLYALPPVGDEARQDPWWVYKIAQARNAGALLDELRAPFRRSSAQ
ncbi:MAG TPA: tetratricopeptide repeat protein [Vicinamibacterales bacterium]|nr:tetratricopeptide repeat protein [Vicinamibacterales bacterium]